MLDLCESLWTLHVVEPLGDKVTCVSFFRYSFINFLLVLFYLESSIIDLVVG